MKRHLHLWIFLCCLCCFLNGFAQSEHPEHTLPTKPVQTPDHSLIPDNSLHPERPEMNPRSVVALPQPDTLAFSFQRSYTLTPWMNKPQLFTTLNQPYVMDYISMTRLGAWHAITSSTSYPLSIRISICNSSIRSNSSPAYTCTAGQQPSNTTLADTSRPTSELPPDSTTRPSTSWDSTSTTNTLSGRTSCTSIRHSLPCSGRTESASTWSSSRVKT